MHRTNLVLAGHYFASAVFLLIFIGCKPQPPAHGTYFLLQVGTNRLEAAAPFSDVFESLRARLETLGLQTFPEALPEGAWVIKVGTLKPNQLSAVRQMITNQGHLEFRIVHPLSNELVEKGLLEPGYELLEEPSSGSRGEVLRRRWLVKKNPERGLTGRHIRHVAVTQQSATSTAEFVFELDADGAQLLEQITSQYQSSAVPHQMAIVVDGQILAISRIMSVISGGRVNIITGLTLSQAFALRSILENPLTERCWVKEERNF